MTVHRRSWNDVRTALCINAMRERLAVFVMHSFKREFPERVKLRFFRPVFSLEFGEFQIALRGRENELCRAFWC